MDDRILERDESFIILADPPSIPDGHSNCSATVTIVDTDGRSPFNSYKAFMISGLTKLSCICTSLKVILMKLHELFVFTVYSHYREI